MEQRHFLSGMNPMQRHCFPYNFIAQRFNITLFLIALQFVPSGTDSLPFFLVQPLHCLAGVTLHNPNVMARS
jgi:hypothetical protein